ncbi:MAG TPA: helix-turn-helix domain-containing protein [Pseudonocardia sp.]|jgi:DNA-binding HxlR family transcriptional regulator|nr:helix-turn-helix domain-containing protein [Pseudonocardia sp.]
MSGKQRADGQRGLTCSIARSLEVLGERWSLLIVREAFSGVTRFADFRAALGVAPDVLTERLRTLVEAGVLERRPYREPGSRPRHDYHLTPAGRDLRLVLAALQQWGDEHCPSPGGPTVVRRTGDGGRAVRVAFVDDADEVVPPERVRFERTAAYVGRPAIAG